MSSCFTGARNPSTPILDELEWRRHDTRLAFPSRDAAVDDLIDLVVAVDGILQLQAARDTRYFLDVMRPVFLRGKQGRARVACMLEAYRYQYILSGAKLPHFQGILADLLLPQQLQRIVDALETLEPGTVPTDLRQTANPGNYH